MKSGIRTVLLLGGDIIVLLVSFFVMLFIAFWGRPSAGTIELHLLPFSILGLLWLLIFFIFNLYDTEASKPTIPHLRQVILSFATAMAAGVIFFYTIPVFKITPKKNLFIFGLSALVFFIFWRRTFYNIFSAYFKKSVVFITEGEGSDPHVKDLVRYISEYPQSGFTILGRYQSIDQFYEKKPGIPELFIVTKDVWKKPGNFEKLYGTNSLVMDLAHACEDILGRVPIETIDEGWFIHNIIHPHEKLVYTAAKRILSFLVASLVLIITSPFLLLSALCIKIYDGGPVFYAQTRVGKKGMLFKLYKLRSMDVDAEKGGPEWSGYKDSRVTPVGRVIRKLHLDEIPQMWNIIRGDIALVGPRPERPEFVEKLEREIPFYYLRHAIIPGFTGWAQIKFRYANSVVDSKEKFEYDLYYLKNRNISMDLGILLRTVQIIFTH